MKIPDKKDTSKEANQIKTTNQIMYDAGYNACIDDVVAINKPSITVRVGKQVNYFKEQAK